jgi:hypothetical protein
MHLQRVRVHQKLKTPQSRPTQQKNILEKVIKQTLLAGPNQHRKKMMIMEMKF